MSQRNCISREVVSVGEYLFVPSLLDLLYSKATKNFAHRSFFSLVDSWIRSSSTMVCFPISRCPSEYHLRKILPVILE